MRRLTASQLNAHRTGPGADFQRIELGRRVLYLRRDFIRDAAAILASLGKFATLSGAGPRRSGFALTLAGNPQLFVRLGRRGGLAQLLFKDIYLGLRARPFRELTLTAEAFRRGIPVAEPVGALVEWVAPLAYRGAFLTRALPGMTLWEFVRTDDDAQVRMHVLAQARQAIDTMHRQGLFHADLNLHNLFVTTSHDSFELAILDLDKAQLSGSPVSPAGRLRNLSRLYRSARKLDPDGRYLDRRSLRILTSSAP
jgi:3-deoxy-D-manno-octulosonic acid kinase